MFVGEVHKHDRETKVGVVRLLGAESVEAIYKRQRAQLRQSRYGRASDFQMILPHSQREHSNSP